MDLASRIDGRIAAGAVAPDSHRECSQRLRRFRMLVARDWAIEMNTRCKRSDFNLDKLATFLQSSAPRWSDRVEDPSPAGVFTLSDSNIQEQSGGR